MRNYLQEFLAEFDDVLPTKTPSEVSIKSSKSPSAAFAASVGKHSAVGARPPGIASSQTMEGLAVTEVLGFPARLMAGLPLPTTLIVEPVTGGARRSLDPQAFASLVRSAALATDATVGAVLAHHGLRLRVVVIDGGAL